METAKTTKAIKTAQIVKDLSISSGNYSVLDSHVIHRGHIMDFVEDTVDLGVSTVKREYTKHKGAAAIIALDSQGRVLLQSQYRHPVRQILWEIPAGLLDKPGEEPSGAARRELLEEADLVADDWRVLVDYFTSPGCSDEHLYLFLARGLSASSSNFEREDEEIGMRHTWVPLNQAADLVLAGQIHSPSAVVGIFAALHLEQSEGGFDALPKVLPELPKLSGE